MLGAIDDFPTWSPSASGYPKLDMNVEIEDARNSSKPRKPRAPGKAGDPCLGNILIAVEAENLYSTLSGARNQLLTYLIIMQHLRLQHDRINPRVCTWILPAR